MEHQNDEQLPRPSGVLPLPPFYRARNKTSSNRTCVAAVNVSPFRQALYD